MLVLWFGLEFELVLRLEISLGLQLGLCLVWG
jgi:hypothetical protein